MNTIQSSDIRASKSLLRVLLRVTGIIMLGLTAPAMGAEAPALPASDAESLIEQGLRLREQKQPAAALELFKHAYALTHTARALAQIGLAESHLRMWADAEEHLRGALDIAGDPWVSENRSKLEAGLEVGKSHLGNLDLGGGPAGATVLLNGRPVATLPLSRPLRVESGAVAMEIRARGFAPYLRSIDVPAGMLTHVEIGVLTPLPEPPPGAAQPSRDGLAGESRPVPASSSRLHLKMAGWASLGVGLAVLAGGAAALVVREAKANQWNQCVNATIDASLPCQAAFDEESVARHLGITGIVLGTAFAATSAVLFALPERREYSSLHAVRCGGGPGLVGVACMGRF